MRKGGCGVSRLRRKVLKRREGAIERKEGEDSPSGLKKIVIVSMPDRRHGGNERGPDLQKLGSEPQVI